MLLSSLVSDLKRCRTDLAELNEPIYIELSKEALVINQQSHRLETDLELYRTIFELLINVRSNYSNIVGDIIFKALNTRTNQSVATELLQTHQLLLRSWQGSKNDIRIVQFIGNKFKGFSFGSGDQWLTAVFFPKQDWEFYASKENSLDIAMFPYMMDKSLENDIQDCVSKKSVIEIFENSLPDWHPLLKAF